MKKKAEIKIIMPQGMMGRSSGDSSIESILRDIAIAASKDSKGEWAEKYGTSFENDVFMMHPFCWCDKEDCKFCDGTNPNFHYKPLDIEVHWYKYIGRGMEYSKKLSAKIVAEIFTNCIQSINTPYP